MSAPATPSSANRPIAASCHRYGGPDSRNAALVQKALKEEKVRTGELAAHSERVDDQGGQERHVEQMPIRLVQAGGVSLEQERAEQVRDGDEHLATGVLDRHEFEPPQGLGAPGDLDGGSSADRAQGRPPRRVIRRKDVDDQAAPGEPVP